MALGSSSTISASRLLRSKKRDKSLIALFFSFVEMSNGARMVGFRLLSQSHTARNTRSLAITH